MNNDCYVHNGKPYWSTVPPECICNKGNEKFTQSSQCTCKCHVSQLHHCKDCCVNILGEVTMVGCPDNIPGCLVMHTKPKEETIVIKKSLWDEMLDYRETIKELATVISNNENEIIEYKNKVDSLIHEVFSTQLNRIDEIQEKQNNFIISVNRKIGDLNHNKNYQIDENRKEARLIEELEKKVNKLESSGNYNKDYGLDLHAEIIKLWESISNLQTIKATIVNYDDTTINEKINRLESIKEDNIRFESLHQLGFDLGNRINELEKKSSRADLVEGCHNNLSDKVENKFNSQNNINIGLDKRTREVRQIQNYFIKSCNGRIEKIQQTISELFDKISYIGYSEKDNKDPSYKCYVCGDNILLSHCIIHKGNKDKYYCNIVCFEDTCNE